MSAILDNVGKKENKEIQEYVRKKQSIEKGG